MNRKAYGFRAPLIVLAAMVLFAGAAAAGFSEEKIQLAILLDTSNSMDGLIEQAKAQLWKVVNELARTKRNGVHPTLEVALFQYGNDGLSEQTGYIQMVSDLTTDLDRISEKLFTLTTNGGSEYCGQVIDRAVSKLSWSSSNDVLKVIYIAGNEPFTQGSVDYTTSDSKAIRRGIIVNTIFCGPRDEGVATSWKDGADRADGRYMSINQDEVAVSIPTPYDKDIVKLGDELNGTYVAYGRSGAAGQERQAAQDANAASVSPAAPVERSVAKAQAAYSNSGWDLVDAVKNKDVKLGALKEEQLPAQMQKMSPAEREKYIQGLAGKRSDLQAKINDLNEKRRVFLASQIKQEHAGQHAGHRHPGVGESGGSEERLHSRVRQQARRPAGTSGPFFSLEDLPPFHGIGVQGLDQGKQLPTQLGQRVASERPLHEPGFLQILDARVEDGGGDGPALSAAEGLQGPEGGRPCSKVPDDAHGPAPSKEVEERHDWRSCRGSPDRLSRFRNGHGGGYFISAMMSAHVLPLRPMLSRSSSWIRTVNSDAGILVIWIASAVSRSMSALFVSTLLFVMVISMTGMILPPASGMCYLKSSLILK